MPVWLNPLRRFPVVATPPAGKALEFFQFVMPGRDSNESWQHARFYVTLASTPILWFVT